MADPLVVQSLRKMRAEILGRIAAYEAQIAQAKHDLAHVNATLRLFSEPEKQRVRYLVSHGFFKKGEIADICVGQLEMDGELTTRELAERVMAARSSTLPMRRYGTRSCSKWCRRFVTRTGAASSGGREAQGDVRLGTRRRGHAAGRCQ